MPKNVLTIEERETRPFLVKAVVTFTRLNAAGNEQKHKRELVFALDEKSAKMPWYALRNFLVPRYLTEEFGPKEVGWQRVYEIKIIQQIDRRDPDDITNIPLRIMTFDQLSRYVAKWELGVPVHEFHSIEKAREMVALREEDEKGYKKHLSEYREGKHRNYPELDELRRDSESGKTVVPVEEFNQLTAREQIIPRVAASPKEDFEKEEKDKKSENPFKGM